MSFPKYETYRESGIGWLGEVPAHWRCVPFLAIARQREETNVGLQETNLLSLSYGRIVVKDITSNEGLLPESFETYQIVFPGDIVFRLTDLQNDKRSLRTAIVREKGIITSAYVAATPCGIDPNYLNYLLRAYDCRKVFYSMGGGLRQSMKYADIKRLSIVVPPAIEQATIAGFLDRETAKIDGLVAEQQRLIELLKEKRRAVISDAVTKGLHKGAPTKESEIGWLSKVPAHWQVRRAKTLSTFVTSGPRGWAERVGEDGPLFVQSGDLNDVLEIEFSSAKRVRVEVDAEARRTRLHDGDVVVCITGAKTGNVAVCCSVPEEAYINQHLCLIRPTEEILPMYLGVVLKSRIGQIYFEFSQYGLKQGLSLEDVRNAVVLLPPRNEQSAIISILDRQTGRLNTLVGDVEAGITLLQERRTALISAAVTGKIDVRGLLSTQPENEAAA